MKVILVDDEEAGLNNLHYYLTAYEDIEILGMYQDVLEALQLILRVKPDAVFLDIMMPETDGLQAAMEILKYDSTINIIFVTAFDEHAVKAFELNAIDYILKPFSAQRIEIVVNRMKRLLASKNTMINQQFLKLDAIKKEIIKIPVWCGDRIILCTPHEISFISSEKGNVSIYTCNGKSYLGKDTLNSFESKLDNNFFFRCHKSFIVNIEKIKEVIPWFNNTCLLNMEGQKEQVAVSRKYIKSFKSIFNL